MKLIAVPLGFTGALDLKTEGGQPDQISQEVRPTFEMEHWYMASAQRTTEAQGNVQAVGDAVSITVPQGERWWIQAMSGNILLTTGQTAPSGFTGALMLSVPPQAVSLKFTNNPPIAAVAGAGTVYGVAMWFDRPLMANGGNALRFRNFSALGQSTAAALSVLYTSFRI